MLDIILMCISCFMFFANELLLAVYFTYILDYGIDVRQKNKFEWFSYSSLKCVIRHWRKFATSPTYLAKELMMNVQCSGGSRSFAKEMRALKMRSTVASHWKLTATNWEDHRTWSSYNYMRSCQGTQCWPFYGHSAFEANWKDEKAR